MPEAPPASTGEDFERQERSLRNLTLPAPLQRRVESYIERKTGKRWDDPEVLERIRTAIIAQKGTYWKEGVQREIRYRSGYSVLAYLGYQMPVFFAQFQHLLLLLARDGLLKESMTVLDVGSGPGVIPLALIDFFRRRGKGEATVHSIEIAEEQLEAYRYLVPSWAEAVPGVRVEPPMVADLTTLPVDTLPSPVDLMVFSNVLNEIPHATTDEQTALLLRYATALAADGTLVVVEPADLANSMQLRRTSLSVSQDRTGLTLYAPCSFLWGRRCTLERCWSFADFGTIHPPDLMQALSEGKEGYRFHNVDLKTSYALFRKDGRTRCPRSIAKGAPALPLSRLSQHIGKVVNVVVAVMSGDIGDRSYRVLRVCDGTSIQPVYAILPRYLESRMFRALRGAQYGDVFVLNEVRVRHNPTHNAINLLITARSRVKPFFVSGMDT